MAAASSSGLQGGAAQPDVPVAPQGQPVSFTSQGQPLIPASEPSELRPKKPRLFSAAPQGPPPTEVIVCTLNCASIPADSKEDTHQIWRDSMETTMRSLMQVEKVDFFIFQELMQHSIRMIMDAEFVDNKDWSVMPGRNQCAIMYRASMWNMVNDNNPKAFPEKKDHENPYRSWRTSLQVSVAAYTYVYADTFTHIICTYTYVYASLKPSCRPLSLPRYPFFLPCCPFPLQCCPFSLPCCPLSLPRACLCTSHIHAYAAK